MKNLFLASQIQDITVKKLVALLNKKPNQIQLCFIPTAGNHQGKKLEDRGSWQAVNKLGFKPEVLDVAGKNQKNVAGVIREADIVLMNGGNTFYLLDQVRKSGADKEITHLLDRGGWYVGSSAGSILATPDIGYIAPMDTPELAPDLTSYRGLGLVDVSIVPHVGNPDYPKANSVIDQFSGNDELVKLSDEQVLVVQGKDKRII